MASWEKQTSSIWPTWEENKLFMVLLGIIMVYGIIWMGVNIKTAMQESRRVGLSDLSAPTIAVSATGTVTATPDIATVDIAVTKQASTATESQSLASAAMTSVINAMKELGIAEDDLKTSNFSTQEVFDYDQSPAVRTGYESRQTLTVKIRETDMTSSVLDAGPANGATSVSSLRYEVDDETDSEQLARLDAMKQAKKQAVEIAKAMGAHLGRVASYSESSGGVYPMYALESAAKNMDSAAPVEIGTQDVSVTVYVTYSVY
jgi:uncharacterized protein YggE